MAAEWGERWRAGTASTPSIEPILSGTPRGLGGPLPYVQESNMSRVDRLRGKSASSPTRAYSLLKRASRSWRDYDLSLEPLETRTILSAAFDVVGLTALRADGNYSAVDGSNIGVAVIDTGLYSAHPDIAPNFVAWYDAVTESSSGTPTDPNGHGTHVAGTAASRNPAIGVATQARLIGIRGLPSENEPYPDHDPVLEGLRWVINHSQQYNIRVVNLSLGSPSNLNGNLPASSYQPFFAELERLGITIVAASGNSYANYASPGSASPGAYSTLTVANTWEDDGRGDVFGGLYGGAGDRYYAYEADAAADRFAATSQRSTLPNQVAAPGSTIYSTWNGSQGKLYNTISGTSMASPLVSGMVALMQDAAFTYGGVYLSPTQVRQIIRDTADNIVDYNVTTNARAEITVDANGRATAGPLLNLPETGLTFKRVNVYRAVQQVRAIVTGHPGDPVPPPPGSMDTNSTIATAIELPSLDGTRSYDFRGNIGTDGSVTPGNNDVDMFKIVLESPGVVTFQTAAVSGGMNFDAFLRLFNSAGNQLAFSDDSGGTLYPTLSSVRLQPGTYYFGISSYNNSSYNAVTGSGAAGGLSHGDYSLTVSLSNPDPNGVFQGAVAVDSLPAFYNGLIGADLGQPVGTQDVDFFEIVAPDTGTLIIDIDTSAYAPGSRVDSYVRVFNSSAMQIAFNDDESQSNLDSYLELPVVRGVRYYVAVASYWNRNFNPSDPFDRSDQGPGGYYDLNLRFTNGDGNGTIGTALVGTIGSQISGVIHDDGGAIIGADGSKDVDFFRFTPGANGLLDVSVSSPNSTLASVVSLWLYNSSTGTATRLADSSGASPRLIVRAVAGQSYYVSVTGLGNNDFNWFAPWNGSGGDTGSYVLSTALRPLSDVAMFADNSVNSSTPTTLVLGQTIDGVIGRDGALIQASDDVDLYRFVPSVTGRYQFRTDSSSLSNADSRAADTFLRVFDAAGTELAYNDDGYIGTTGSFIRLSLTAGQTYYIGVSGTSGSPRQYNPLTGAGAVSGSTGAYVLLGTVATELRGTPTLAIGGSVAGNAANQFTHSFTMLNTNGSPVLFQQLPGASWRAVDLGASTNSPTITSNVVTWVDSKDGLTYVAANSVAGLLLFTNTAGQWTLRNLSAEIAGSGVITTELSTFTETTGIVNLTGLNAQGHLLLFTQTGAGSSGAYVWRFADITTRDLMPQGQVMPAFVGNRVTAYVTSWNGLNVAGLTASGEIHTVWWAPGLQRWQTTNLTAVTGAGQLSGGLTVYLTPWGGINLAGINSQGKVSVTWWVPGFAGEWRNNNLSNESGGPSLSSNSITSYVTAWGALNIAGLDGQGKVVIYWWVPGFQLWRISSISDEVPGSKLPVGRLTGVTGSGYQGTLNVLGTASDGDIVRYWWRPNDVWHQDDLSEIAVPT